MFIFFFLFSSFLFVFVLSVFDFVLSFCAGMIICFFLWTIRLG